MKMVAFVPLLDEERFFQTVEWKQLFNEIRAAVNAVVWPEGNDSFILHDCKGRGRGQGNGVKPIKEACMLLLQKNGWNINERTNLFRLDATKLLKSGKYIGLEWETGNISSSHRAINRLLRGQLENKLDCGVLIVPTREMYKYLTDRIGNLGELEPYFPLWRSMRTKGALAVITVEHDGVSSDVPRIKKGTDGRALT
jgi:hypothetical protein